MKLLYGEHSYEDGSIYYGQWNSEGKKHGIGKYTLSDGKSIYVGEFNQGSCEGLGVLTTPNFVMQGQFKEVSLFDTRMVLRGFCKKYSSFDAQDS